MSTFRAGARCVGGDQARADTIAASARPAAQCSTDLQAAQWRGRDEAGERTRHQRRYHLHKVRLQHDFRVALCVLLKETTHAMLLEAAPPLGRSRQALEHGN